VDDGRSSIVPSIALKKAGSVDDYAPDLYERRITVDRPL
jgi:hypothetical protein